MKGLGATGYMLIIVLAVIAISVSGVLVGKVRAEGNDLLRFLGFAGLEDYGYIGPYHYDDGADRGYDYLDIDCNSKHCFGVHMNMNDIQTRRGPLKLSKIEKVEMEVEWGDSNTKNLIEHFSAISLEDRRSGISCSDSRCYVAVTHPSQQYPVWYIIDSETGQGISNPLWDGSSEIAIGIKMLNPENNLRCDITFCYMPVSYNDNGIKLGIAKYDMTSFADPMLVGLANICNNNIYGSEPIEDDELRISYIDSVIYVTCPDPQLGIYKITQEDFATGIPTNSNEKISQTKVSNLVYFQGGNDNLCLSIDDTYWHTRPACIESSGATRCLTTLSNSSFEGGSVNKPDADCWYHATYGFDTLESTTNDNNNIREYSSDLEPGVEQYDKFYQPTGQSVCNRDDDFVSCILLSSAEIQEGKFRLQKVSLLTGAILSASLSELDYHEMFKLGKLGLTYTSGNDEKGIMGSGPGGGAFGFMNPSDFRTLECDDRSCYLTLYDAFIKMRAR